MKNYGKAIKALRKTANMTQAQLADKLSVTPQTVSKWENGVNTPDIDAVESLCSLFKVSMDEFMRMADDSVAPIQPAPAQPTAPVQPETSVVPQPTAPTAAQPAPASAAAPAEKSKRLKPIHITIISIVAAVIAFVAVLVPILVTRSSLKVLTANEIYQKVNPSVFYIEVETETNTVGGSGFFINNTGTGVTNYHVVDGIKSAKVTLSNGETYAVDKILGVDNVRDVAMIHVAVPSSTPVTFADSNSVKTGDKVYAIGFPQSFVLGVQDSTLTEGLVSKSAYNIDGVNYIQSTVDITHGNSGGVLVDVYGRVIGMTTAGIDFGNIDYMNLSVPANTVKNVKQNVNLAVTEFSAQSNIRYEVKYTIEGEVYALREVSALFEKIPDIKPVLVGAEFLGWYEDPLYETPFDFSKQPTRDVEIYGKIRYTDIVFEFTGGKDSTGEMDDIIVASGEELTLPDCEFEREGYIFSCWSYGGLVYDAGETLEVNDGVPLQTVTAKWTPVTYSVAYRYEDSVTKPVSCTYDKAFRLEDALFTREGYNQVGWWYKNTTYSLRESVRNITAENGKAVELIPEWAPIQFTIKLLFNEPEVIFQGVKYGTDNGRRSETYLCTYDEDPFDGAIPRRDPFVFDCWKATRSDGTQYEGYIENACTEDGGTVTAQAVWMSGKYTLVLDVDSVKVELYGRESFTIPTIEELGKAKYNPGKRFVGWRHMESNPTVIYPDGATVSDMMFDGYYHHLGITVFVRLYSMWEPIDYTVKFDGNGGNGTMQGLSCKYGTKFTLPKNTFVRPGYTFIGWEHGDKVYADESEVTSLTTKDGEEITLKAKWVNGYDGDGTESSPYTINNYAELADLYLYVENIDGYDSAHYVLTADIDCAGKKLYPIGSSKKNFTGVFDGGGHVIKNALLAPTDGTYRIFGLFGFVKDGQIKNVGLEQYDYVRGNESDRIFDDNVRGDGAGAIAYYYQSALTLEKCYATTTKMMYFNNNWITCVGGLVGSLDGSMENCYAAYNATLILEDRVYSNDVYIGGLAGITLYDGSIQHCYSDVNINVKMTATYQPNTLNLGLIAAKTYRTNIDYCFTIGSIVYDVNRAGASKTMYDEQTVGLISGVGTDDKSATALYTAGKVTFTDVDNAKGGVYEGQLTASYDDLCSVDWLNQHLGFDKAVWKDSTTGLPTLNI